MEKNTPKLRFPGFDGEWEEKKLGSISKHLEYGLNSAACDYDGKNGYIRITDIDTDGNYIKSNQVSPKGIFSDDYLVKEGDILFARTGASTGKNYRYREDDGNLFYAGFLIRARIKKDFNHEFVYYSMKTKRYENWVKLMSMRSGQPGINAKEYSSYNIGVPTKAEQDKLADFLSTIDSRIALQLDKVDTLTKLKKGTIQKIFSQEIRFKREDGSEYLEWEEKKLGEMGLFSRGHSYNAGNVRNEGLLVLRSNNIQNNKIDFSEKALQFVNKDCKDNIELKKNDIVICMANGSKKLVGKTAIYNGEYIGKATVGAFCSIFRGEYPIGKYLFQTNNYFETLGYLLEGTNISNLKNDALAEIIFEVPSEFEEQQKIADFFSTIDSKIDTETQILSTLQTLKKGLLQQMFV